MVTVESDTISLTRNENPDLSQTSRFIAIKNKTIPPKIIDSGLLYDDASFGSIEGVQVFGTYDELNQLFPECDSTQSIITNYDEYEKSPNSFQKDKSNEKIVFELPYQYRVSYEAGNRIYRIPKDELVNISDPYFVYHGTPIPVLDETATHYYLYLPQTDSETSPYSTIFVGEDLNNEFGSAPEREAFPTLSATGTEQSISRSKNFSTPEVYFQIVPDPDDPYQYMYFLDGPDQYQGNLQINDRLANSTVVLEIKVYGMTQSVSLDPDHYMTLALGNLMSDQITWEGRDSISLRSTFMGTNQNSDRTITFTHTIPNSPVTSASGVDRQAVASLDLTWTGFPSLDASGHTILDLEAIVSKTSRTITVAGIPDTMTTDDLFVLDISESTNPVLLTDYPFQRSQDGSLFVEFEVPSSASSFLVQRKTSINEPDSLVDIERMPDYSNEEMFIVLPEEYNFFIEEYQDLYPDIDIYSFSPQMAYNEYNNGESSAEAIRDALRDLANASSENVPTVLLIGHASLDPADNFEVQDTPQVPCFIEPSVRTDTGYLENSVDYPYARLFGDDFLPDAKLARIHATSVENLQLYLNKLKAYHAQIIKNSSTDRSGVFVAGLDRPPLNPNNFIDDQDEWTSLWENSSRDGIQINRDDFTSNAEVFDQIKLHLESNPGAHYLQYMGHGFEFNWDTNAMMSISRVMNIDTSESLPFITTFTCFNGYYAYPGRVGGSLSEAWLYAAEDRGGIATLAPVSADFYLEQSFFARYVLEGISSNLEVNPPTLGDWIFETQARYAVELPGFSITLQEYILFGDPNLPTFLTDQAFLSDLWQIQ